MRPIVRQLTLGVILVVTALIAGCEGGGIGIGTSLPTGGARWGSGFAGPDVFVGGGPTYR